MNELHLMLQHLKQPEYIHVMLNPLPLYGTAMGVLALIVGLLMRSRQAQVVALIVVLLGCSSAYPVLRYGQRGYDRVYAMSNPAAQAWLDVHMDRAESFAYVFYATGVVALLAILAAWKWQNGATYMSIVVLLMAITSVGFAGWISHAGGQVRHSEFRNGLPPTEGDHHAEDHDHEHEHHHEHAE